MLFFCWCYTETLPPLYSVNAKQKKTTRDIAVLHMGTDDILNAEGDKDLITESVIGIANECVIELLTGVMCFKHFPVFLAFYESMHSKG